MSAFTVAGMDTDDCYWDESGEHCSSHAIVRLYYNFVHQKIFILIYIIYDTLASIMNWKNALTFCTFANKIDIFSSLSCLLQVFSTGKNLKNFC